jgi:hypothetical protein
MSQSGNIIGWRVPRIGETGTGTVQGRTITISWNGQWGRGSATGTVSVGANRIDWNNGVNFTR